MKKYIDIIIQTIASIFLPLINLLSAAGIMKGLLAILMSIHLLTVKDDIYVIFDAMADTIFYFLPVLIAFTTAKKFKVNQMTAVIIALCLVYPSLTEIFAKGESLSFFHLTIPSVNYPTNIIPVILAIGLLHFVEKGLEQCIPEIVKGFLIPIFSIVIVTLVTLFLFGPIGSWIGDILAKGYELIYKLNPMIAGLFLGGFIQIMVIFGFHWSLIPIAISNITLHGTDTILALMGPAVFAQAGATLGVFLKTKDSKFRSTCLSAVISALFGVTEPAMFGVNLPLKKPMIAVCIAGAIGGAIGGSTKAAAISFAFPGLMTIPVFMGSGFIGYLISIGTGFILGFIFTMIFKFDTHIQQA